MRGKKGTGPFAGRGKKATSLAEVAARSGNGQQASAGATTGTAAAAATGKGRGKGRSTAGKNTARRGSGQKANTGQQRAENLQPQHNGDGGSNGATNNEVNGVKIEVVAIPGRGGRPQQAEAFPFAALDVSTKDGENMVGPSFMIPEGENADNILAAARKRHKGKSFTARKMEGGVRIWRLS